MIQAVAAACWSSPFQNRCGKPTGLLSYEHVNGRSEIAFSHTDSIMGVVCCLHDTGGGAYIRFLSGCVPRSCASL